MSHLKLISQYAAINVSKQVTINRKETTPETTKFLLKTLKHHSSERVLLAGIGSGVIADALADKCERLVVVEPSLELIKQYKQKTSYSNIYYINGNLSELPVDYYAVTAIVCIDYIDFNDVATVIDEFKRVIDFEGVLVISNIVLHKDDVEGVYDDLFHMLMPMHNDFYLPEDLNTVLGLKRFTALESVSLNSNTEIDKYRVFGSSYKDEFDFKQNGSVDSFIEDNIKILETLYHYKDGSLKEPYMISSFKSEKPPKDDYDQEVKDYLRKTGKSVS